MQTEDFIERLTRDLAPRWSLRRMYTLWILAGIVVAGALFVPTLGVRSDLDLAMHTVRFDFKFALTLSLAVAAAGLLFPLSRPGAKIGEWKWILAAVPFLLAASVVLELLATPEASWRARLVGSNALPCLTAIPLLSAGPLVCLLAGLRYGAPTRPGLIGAVAGLAASGIGASFYASHCPDDSPLFVATWYVIGTAIVVIAGAIMGRRLLRWGARLQLQNDDVST